MTSTILEHLERSFNTALICLETTALPPYWVKKHLVARWLIDGNGHLYAQWVLEESARSTL